MTDTQLKWPGDINPATCSDLEWFNVTAGLFCGGCGNEVANCHPGQACGNVVPAFNPFGFVRCVCDLCPARLATGEINALRATS